MKRLLPKAKRTVIKQEGNVRLLYAEDGIHAPVYQVEYPAKVGYIEGKLRDGQNFFKRDEAETLYARMVAYYKGKP